jgi:ADP-ribose pyrophosphatase
MRIDVESRRVLHDGFLHVDEVTFRQELLDGSMSAPITREVLSTSNAVAVLLWNPQTRNLIFVEEYRAAVNSWSLGLAAGNMDHEGEDPRTVAIREAREETGYQVTHLEDIIEYESSQGKMTEKVMVYYGECTERVGEGGGLPEEEEYLRVVELTSEEAFILISDGKIKAASAIIALQWFAVAKAANTWS